MDNIARIRADCIQPTSKGGQKGEINDCWERNRRLPEQKW